MIELMVVLVILVLLVTMIVPNIVGKSDDAKQTKARTDIAMIEALLDQFYLDLGSYPSQEDGLRVLYSEPDDEPENWKGPYSKKPIPDDPWGNPYRYEIPGTHSNQPYEIWSLGRDGQEGGEDFDEDIVSWVDVEDN
jgi:general secretion pathway protein G